MASIAKTIVATGVSSGLVSLYPDLQNARIIAAHYTSFLANSLYLTQLLGLRSYQTASFSASSAL
jgi:hypothetical protein